MVSIRIEKTVILRRGRSVLRVLIDNLSYRLDQNGPFNIVEALQKRHSRAD